MHNELYIAFMKTFFTYLIKRQTSILVCRCQVTALGKLHVLPHELLFVLHCPTTKTALPPQLSFCKEIEKIYLMFQFLSLIGPEIFFCSVSQRNSSAVQPTWLIAEVSLYQYKWFLYSFNQKNVFTAHIYNPCKYLLVRNLCVKLLLEWLKESLFSIGGQ